MRTFIFVADRARIVVSGDPRETATGNIRDTTGQDRHGQGIGQLTAAGSIAGTELIELQKLSATVTITAATLNCRRRRQQLTTTRAAVS